MEQDSDQANPFAAPTSPGRSSWVDPRDEIREFSLPHSVLKWLLICGVSGAPSFLLAFSIGTAYLVQSMAMACGILTFVVAYVFIESRSWTQEKLTDKTLRIAVRIGYITRVSISILFPFAFFVDIFCGVFSIGIATNLFGQDLSGHGEELATLPTEVTFAWFYITTLIQGVFLNIVLAAYTLVVYGIALLVRAGGGRS